MTRFDNKNNNAMKFQMRKIQDEIVHFSQKLQSFIESPELRPHPEEIIEILNGIGQGSLSCANLMKDMLNKNQLCQQTKDDLLVDKEFPTVPDGSVRAILDDSKFIVRECKDISTALRRIKFNIIAVRNEHPDHQDRIDLARQQVQAALTGLAIEWEDL